MAVSDRSATCSTCPYCGVGCGVLLRPDDQGKLDVEGDPNHPANHGRLCSKGAALGETVGTEHRLLAPRVDGQDTSWDVATQLVADRFSKTIAEHGPDSVAFYVSGQLLTEDYYIANKLMKGYIGSANIDTNSRLCMASSVVGHKRAFGTDTVPGTYEDIDMADLVVLVGSNLAWCHPVLYQRLLAARKARGTKIVVIDPRHTASCSDADMHLAIQPGSDVALFNRLLVTLFENQKLDETFISHTNRFDEALLTAQNDTIAPIGVSEAEIEDFCDLWARTDKVVTIYSQGVNQSTSGSDKVNAILNCHLATGRIGTPGCGPFSVTGQPNAMGGREVGGLANMLACHLDLENADHRAAVAGFWGVPKVPDKPGLKAVDMFRAVSEGKIKALWIIHTNPAVTMPEADAVRDAIANCPFVVVSDITAQTDTARLADVLLPATAWAEKNGTVTNSERLISRQRAVLPAPGQSRPDWVILADVARRMGFEKAFQYANEAEIFREYAALSALAGKLGRDFDISGLADISDQDYAEFTPQRWPITPARRGGRFFAEGQFFHPDGKAQILPVKWQPPAAQTTPRFPFRLNTGRLRDQWHTMTRTALSARLSAHLAEPFLDIHPDDAASLTVKLADLVELNSPHGAAILRARITDAVQKGQVFAPMHWTSETAPSARIDALIAAAHDPVSGQPESKAAAVAVRRYKATWYGFAVSREPMSLNCDYWALSRTEQGFRAELAGQNAIEDWETHAREIFQLDGASLSAIFDTKRGMTNIVAHKDGKLIAALFVSPNPVAVMRDYLARLPGTDNIDVLSGRASADVPNTGPVLCSCFSIGIGTILQAIETQQLVSVEQIGEALGAGTNCGSCRPEIAAVLQAAQSREAAE